MHAAHSNLPRAAGKPIPHHSAEELANVQCSEWKHKKAIWSKMQRRDEKLNEQLLPPYDPTGRQFVASDDPRLQDREFVPTEREVQRRV